MSGLNEHVLVPVHRSHFFPGGGLGNPLVNNLGPLSAKNSSSTSTNGPVNRPRPPPRNPLRVPKAIKVGNVPDPRWMKALREKRVPKRKRKMEKKVHDRLLARANGLANKENVKRRRLAWAQHKWRQVRGPLARGVLRSAAAAFGKGATHQQVMMHGRRITRRTGKRCFIRKGKKYCRKTSVRRRFVKKRQYRRRYMKRRTRF